MRPPAEDLLARQDGRPARPLGFYIVEADDLDAALTWAAKTSAAIHMPIEVRPFFDATANG